MSGTTWVAPDGVEHHVTVRDVAVALKLRVYRLADETIERTGQPPLGEEVAELLRDVIPHRLGYLADAEAGDILLVTVESTHTRIVREANGPAATETDGLHPDALQELVAGLYGEI